VVKELLNPQTKNQEGWRGISNLVTDTLRAAMMKERVCMCEYVFGVHFGFFY